MLAQLPIRQHEIRDRWLGRLALQVQRSGERSVLRNVSHVGPLRVQRAFYPEADGTCHVYVLHPPGGVVGGDDLELSVELGQGAKCLITTPGATKLYRCELSGSRLSNHLTVGDGARLDYLPQETIAFSGSQSHIRTVVELHGTAAYLGWDIVCLGRKAADEAFSRGSLTLEQRVTRDGIPLLAERLHLTGSGDVLGQAWGLSGRCVLGTLVIAVQNTHWVDFIRKQLPEARGSELMWSGSELDGISVFRALGYSSSEVRHVLQLIWDACRREMGSGGHHSPRIWNV